MGRVIGHLDLDYFYAQVEEVQEPSIKTRPVVVCVFSGRSEDSGVVSTANYIARSQGVRSGMPIALAKRKLKDRDPIFVKMDHAKYEVVSERVMDLLQEEFRLVEQSGIDEAFFDLSETTEGSFLRGEKAAISVKNSILSHEGLTCSIGLGVSKAVAKIASDSAKPNGLIVVPAEKTEDFLSPLPVERLLGVGPKTAAVLKSLGVNTLGDLSRLSSSTLRGRLGDRLSNYLVSAARGLDEDPVTPRGESKQMGRIITLKSDTRNPSEIMNQLEGAIEDLHSRLEESQKSFRNVSAVAILTDLSAKTRTRSLGNQTTSIQSISDTVLSLFEEICASTEKDLRRAGLSLSGFKSAQGQSTLAQFTER